MAFRQTVRSVLKPIVRSSGLKPAAQRVLAVQRPLVRSITTKYDDKVMPEDTNRHRSNAEDLIAQVPVVEVEGNVAVCDGGGGALGHPLEYIQLNRVEMGAVETCKYCGVRYKKKFH